MRTFETTLRLIGRGRLVDAWLPVLEFLLSSLQLLLGPGQVLFSPCDPSCEVVVPLFQVSQPLAE
jgi:hypothetical protein